MSDDVTSVEVEVVEEPPYRMVPGHDRVCTGDVLRRYIPMTPSNTQLKRKVDWRRENADVHSIIGILTRQSGMERVNSSSGNPGFHTTIVSKIREVHVRWYGNPSEEGKHLEHIATILRNAGFTVLVAEENNVDWQLSQSRSFILGRRNRRFLRVAKFHALTRRKKKR